MKPDKPEPGSDPIISDGAARFTWPCSSRYSPWEWPCSSGEASVLFQKETTGLTRSWVHCIPFQRSPPILLVLYLALAARIYAERQEELLRLRFQQGLTEGWKQAARRFEQEAPRDLAVLDRVEEVGLSRPHGGLAGVLAAAVAGKPRELTRPVTLDTQFHDRP